MTGTHQSLDALGAHAGEGAQEDSHFVLHHATVAPSVEEGKRKLESIFAAATHLYMDRSDMMVLRIFHFTMWLRALPRIIEV